MAIAMINVKCIICGSDSYKILSSHRDDQFLKRLEHASIDKVRVVICKKCGLVYQNPRVAPEDLQELYAKGYRLDLPSEKYFRIIGDDAAKKLEWLGKYIDVHLGTSRKVLDVGCAVGIFLNMFNERGWNCFGIEPNGLFARYGRQKYGLNIKTEPFTPTSFDGLKFDLIIASHVLEHVPNPCDFLAIAREKLDDNGYFYVEVPNIYKPKSPLYTSFFASQHLFVYSPKTLGLILRKSGFEIMENGQGERGFRVLAKRGEFINRFEYAQEGDDYKKIYRDITKFRIKHFFKASCKRFWTSYWQKSVKWLICRIFGQTKGDELIKSVKKF